MGEALTREMTIVNERGLHARAAGAVMQLCDDYEAEVTIAFDGETADACSIMDLLTLAATRGSVIEACATGPQAAEVLDALEAMVADRFGEER